MQHGEGALIGDSWRGLLLLGPWPGTVLYVGPGGAADRHAHHAVQLTIGVGAPVRVTLGDGQRVSAHAVIVPSGVSHEFAADGAVAMFYADPSSAIGRQLRRAADGPAGLVREADEFAPPPDLAASDPLAYLGRWLDRFGVTGGSTVSVSDRISRVLAYVEQRIRADGTTTLGDAARHATMSPSRLTQVFTNEVGIPFRRYALWLRLVVAIETVGLGTDLTRAAAAAGFSDSAHLSRTFRANFGLPPSALLHMDVVHGQLSPTGA